MPGIPGMGGENPMEGLMKMMSGLGGAGGMPGMHPPCLTRQLKKHVISLSAQVNLNALKKNVRNLTNLTDQKSTN